MSKTTEIITVILGTLGTFLIFNAAITTESGNIKGAASLGSVLFHFIVVMIALPFLLSSTYRAESIPRWFRNWIITLSVLNAIFMALSSNATSENKGPFFVFALLELIPILIFRQNQLKVLPKNVMRDPEGYTDYS